MAARSTTTLTKDGLVSIENPSKQEADVLAFYRYVVQDHLELYEPLSLHTLSACSAETLEKRPIELELDVDVIRRRWMDGELDDWLAEPEN